jgi:1-piperideine-2-carboxylate/1-pyrroline-2-carboxylate reductase [NAD(P)H]
MQLFNALDTAQALPYARLVPALAQAAQQLAQAAQQLAHGEINAPERQVVPIDDAGVLLCMPAIGADLGVTKLITVHGDNARHGLPAIQGEVLVFDRATGRRLALLDGPTVTARRTAAMSLLGIRALAPAAPRSALLIGSGVQAAAHADALIEFFGVSQLWIAGRDRLRTQAFCEALRLRQPQATPRPIGMDDIAAVCRQVDVVIALTTSRTPVVPDTLPPQVLAVGVGAFKPEMAELPAARHEAGDLLQAGVDWNAVRDIADVLAHGFTHNEAAPILKTVGHAAWDLAAARVAMDTVG